MQLPCPPLLHAVYSWEPWLGAHDDKHHLAVVTSIRFLAAYLRIYVFFVIARGVLKKLDYFQSRFGQSEVQNANTD